MCSKADSSIFDPCDIWRTISGIRIAWDSANFAAKPKLASGDWQLPYVLPIPSNATKSFCGLRKMQKVFTFTHNNSTARIPILPNIENHFWLHPYKRGKDWFNLDIRSFRALCFCIQGLVPLGLCVRFWKMKTVKDLINREFGAEWTCRSTWEEMPNGLLDVWTLCIVHLPQSSVNCQLCSNCSCLIWYIAKDKLSCFCKRDKTNGNIILPHLRI